MTSEIKVRVETRGGAVIVSPEGDVDMARSPALRDHLRRAAVGKPQRLVVNLVDVAYMDSSGVATLVEALQHTRKQSTKLILCEMQDRVRSIFEIARLDTVFPIVATLDAALST